jgi:hypothetical protein
LIARGQLREAEAYLVQAIASGLLAREAATRLQEKISERKQNQSPAPDRNPSPRNLGDFNVEETDHPERAMPEDWGALQRARERRESWLHRLLPVLRGKRAQSPAVEEVPHRMVGAGGPMDPRGPIEELQSLRLAAAQGSWNGCQAATERLLCRLPFLQALAVARDFAASRLPLFERHQPGVHWPREFIASVCEPEAVSETRRWPQDDDFAGPGANNFISAVQALWTTRQQVADQHSWPATLAVAIAGTIMAERNEFWGSRDPEAWAHWYQLAPDSDDPSRFKTLIAVAREPEVMKTERAAWLEVADRLEAALQGG